MEDDPGITGSKRGRSWLDRLLGRSESKQQDEPSERVDDVPLLDEQGKEVRGGLGSLPFTG
jgi:hypothetical protein